MVTGFVASSLTLQGLANPGSFLLFLAYHRLVKSIFHFTGHNEGSGTHDDRTLTPFWAAECGQSG